MISIVKHVVRSTIMYGILCMATFLMLRMIVGYAGFDTKYAFLAEKQDYITNRVWLFAFYTHVFTSLFTLIAGFTQFSGSLLKQYKKIHRLAGKMYIISVLFINVPAGFIMAVYANGLLPSKIAFLILDASWFYFTWKGWRTALKKNFVQHRRWMIRSYALTFSAVTLRTWRMILATFIADAYVVYMLDAWLGFVPNILLVEWLLYRERKSKWLPVKIDGDNIQQSKAYH